MISSEYQLLSVGVFIFCANTVRAFGSAIVCLLSNFGTPCGCRDVCVCVTGRRDEALGRGTRRGRATDTAGPRAVEHTHIGRPVPAHTAVSKHQPRPAQAAARPRGGCAAGGARSAGDATRAEDPHVCVC